MKKIFALALCFLTIFGLSACGKSQKVDIKEKNIAPTAKVTKKWSKINDEKASVVSINCGESFELDFEKEVTFNSIVLKEKTDNVKQFKIYKFNSDGAWELIYQQDRILNYRLCYVEPTTTTKIKFELTQCYENKKPVKLKEMEVYNYAKTDNNEFKVSQYLVMDKNEIVNLRDTNDAGFSGYYDVVTDTIIIGCVSMNSNCEIEFSNGEKDFENNINALKDIIGQRKVRIWSTILFDQKDSNGEKNHDLTKDFINNNIDKITKSINDFVEKYDLYGIDLDWEYPSKSAQWKAYDKMIQSISKITKVSVALPTWGIKLSKDSIKTIEHVNLMTYDLFDKRGDHSNCYIGGIDGINKLRKAGFSDKQILLGIPTYGRTTDKSANAWPVYRDSKFLGKWGNFIADYEYTEDNATKKCDGYLNGFAMVRDKTALAQAAEIGGVMLFRAKCDEPYTYEYSLHKAVKEVIDNY